MSWAHADPRDAEWNAFVSGNASGSGGLVFGRVTFEMMAAFWPTPAATQAMPGVAAGMNARTKFVVSRTLDQQAIDAKWSNTTLLGGNLVDAIRALKAAGWSRPDGTGERFGRHATGRRGLVGRDPTGDRPDRARRGQGGVRRIIRARASGVTCAPRRFPMGTS
ncbi:MAG: hypothetical protein QM811_13950 [Pirellulales bacterium]